jgi:hypothetical protein
MEIPELKVVALMLTSSKLPLIFCATSGCREMTIFLIFILRIWIQIRIRIHNSCLPSEKTIWSKKTTFYGEMPELKDVSVLQLLIQVFNPNLHNWVVKVTYMVAIRKDNLVKKDDISRGNAWSKSCSPDPEKFKTTFESSVPLPVPEKWRFSCFRHVWPWEPTSVIDKAEPQ